MNNIKNENVQLIDKAELNIKTKKKMNPSHIQTNINNDSFQTKNDVKCINVGSVNDTNINLLEPSYSQQPSHHLVQYSLHNPYYHQFPKQNLHYYAHQTPKSVCNQDLHYLQPGQFYYLHNQPQFYVNASHQCQHTVQPVTTIINKSISENNYHNNLNKLTDQHKQYQIQNSNSNSNSHTNQNSYQNQNFHKPSNSSLKKNTMNSDYFDEHLNKKRKKWEMFPGSNRFCCDGRLMISKHIGVFYFTLSLLIFTCTLFFIFDCPFLASNVNQFIPVVGAILFIFSLSTLLRTSFTDPGIIPRANTDEIAYTEREVEKANNSSSPTFHQSPRIKEVIINNQVVKLKYCITCKIYRPPRSSHCSMCDNCVERFDHHCPWVGNCIGKRNYRYFYMFILSLSALCVFVFVCVLTHLVILIRKENFLEAVRKSPASVLESIICFLSLWSVLALAGFHTYLICINQTTNEDIKSSFTSKKESRTKNPYSENSIFKNCFVLLCGPNNPSLIDARGYFDPHNAPPFSYYKGGNCRKVTNDLPYPKQQTINIQENEQNKLLQHKNESILLPQTSEYQQNHVPCNDGNISTISSKMSHSFNSDINLNQQENYQQQQSNLPSSQQQHLHHLNHQNHQNHQSHQLNQNHSLNQNHQNHHNHQLNQINQISQINQNHSLNSKVNIPLNSFSINNKLNHLTNISTINLISNENNLVSRVENKKTQQKHIGSINNSLVYDGQMITKVNKNGIQINSNEKKSSSNNLIIKQSAV